MTVIKEKSTAREKVGSRFNDRRCGYSKLLLKASHFTMNICIDRSKPLIFWCRLDLRYIYILCVHGIIVVNRFSHVHLAREEVTGIFLYQYFVCINYSLHSKTWTETQRRNLHNKYVLHEGLRT